MTSLDRYEILRDAFANEPLGLRAAHMARLLLSQAEERKVKQAEVRAWAQKAVKSAALYGPSTLRNEQLVVAQTLADQAGLDLAPHFAMEIHLHLAAAYPREPWVEHFEWLDPLFEERLETRDGRMLVPDRPGLGVTLSGQARAWTTDSVAFGRS